MNNGEHTMDERFEELRNRLKELTEMPQLAETPFRFLALIGQHESNPEAPDNPFLNGEMYSAADVEDLGDMLGMLVNAVLENHEDHPEAQRYLIECVLESMRDYLDFEEDEDMDDDE
ncbi:MAG: hypothetical protein H6568_05595 [Lewinellaceae bacterium]|nr:hypothetical protein [Saprospiraceae bacterium]MCB9312221.1 hypothetical protein [Lewinellaceae bacterium]HRW75734.1 hypothetical protein [Saprospiraceae bacterium]